MRPFEIKATKPENMQPKSHRQVGLMTQIHYARYRVRDWKGLCKYIGVIPRFII